MNFEQVPEFRSELKKLTKKWRSLPNDLLDAEKLIVNLYVAQEEKDKLSEYRAAFFNGKRAAIINRLDDGTEVVKMRLDCASLNSNSKIRLVFIVVRIGSTVRFIEIYAKKDKSMEDLKRIKKYLVK